MQKNSYQRKIKVNLSGQWGDLCLYFVNCYLKVFLPVADALFAVFASSEVHRIDFFAFDDGVFGSGLE